MQNSQSGQFLITCWSLLLAAGLLTSCAVKPLVQATDGSRIDSNALVNYQPRKLEPSEPLRLELSRQKGRTEQTLYQSRSLTKTYDSGQLVHEREETVDFTIRSVIREVDEKRGLVSVRVDAVQKEGATDLHDLAFPELGEFIDMVLDQSAKVLSAGKYPKDSIFFVPPVSLPGKPVQIGDTWNLVHRWSSLKNGIPLEVEVVSILKNLYDCGQKRRCADIEISGDVKIPVAVAKGVSLESRVMGRLLFNVDAGSVIWADIRNQEKFKSGEVSMEVWSCTESVIESPEMDRWPWRQQPKCDPAAPAPDRVPGA